MKITQALLDSLTEQTKSSPRPRMNFGLRNSPDNQFKRMLNAIEPSTVKGILLRCSNWCCSQNYMREAVKG